MSVKVLRYLANRFVVVSSALVVAATSSAFAGDSSQSESSTDEQQNSVTVESYETRSQPTHEVSLHDDRVYFLKKLEETETGYVLHTMEDEVIEVERDAVADIKELDGD